MLTCGVRGKGAETVREVISRMQEYDNFSQDNDVYKEHDFGSIDNNGQRYFWKIDYYDQRLLMHSPDPADPDVTCRVLTVIRTLRKAKGFSQEDFAHECDLHRTYMGDVERGERNVSLDNIAIISYALGITISDLFNGIK